MPSMSAARCRKPLGQTTSMLVNPARVSRCTVRLPLAAGRESAGSGVVIACGAGCATTGGAAGAGAGVLRQARTRKSMWGVYARGVLSGVSDSVRSSHTTASARGGLWPCAAGQHTLPRLLVTQRPHRAAAARRDPDVLAFFQSWRGCLLLSGTDMALTTNLTSRCQALHHQDGGWEMLLRCIDCYGFSWIICSQVPELCGGA